MTNQAFKLSAFSVPAYSSNDKAIEQECAFNAILDEHRVLMELDNSDILLFKSLEHSFVINLLFKSTSISGLDFTINFVDFLHDLIEKQRERHCPLKSIETLVSTNFVPLLSTYQATALGIFAYEIIHNTLINSISSVNEPRFDIHFEQSETEVELWISDNGLGITQALLLNESARNGLHVLRVLETQLNGTLVFKQKGGTSIGIRFKKEQK